MLSVKEIKEKLARGETLTREEKIKLLNKPRVKTPRMSLAMELRKKEIEGIAERNPGEDANRLYNLLHRAKIKNRATRRFKRKVHKANLKNSAERR